jgi:hypothetical protein
MPRIAYAQPGPLPGAFAPIPAYAGFGLGPWATTRNVSGQPGTQGVPAGLGDFGSAGAQVNGLSVRGGGAGYSQGTGTMPGAWYPQLWYLQRLDGATLVSGNTQTMSVYSDNQMPVPAADPLGRAAVLGLPPVFVANYQAHARRRGQAGTSWPRWLPSVSYGQ